MLRLTNPENPRRRTLCVLLILFGVCALTARVATRYCDSRGLSETTSVQKQLSPQAVHQRMTQRLAKSTPTSLPPVTQSAALQAPSFYPKFAPAGPPVPGLVFESSLYNRPPPSC